MKKAAIINDLSGFGKCSLTAAIPVLSVMGVQPCPLPTAVLTAQTGYEHYYCDDYTDRMEHFTREWEKMGVSFDGIYTGFLMSVEQVEQINFFLNQFQKEDTLLMVDPVLGDDGTTHANYSKVLLEEMKKLADRADVITPNLTELCFLADEDFSNLTKEENPQKLFDKVEAVARQLCNREDKKVIVTGIRYQDKEHGIPFVANLCVTKEEHYLSASPFMGGSYSGTGDLFASVILGSLLRGDGIERSMQLAGEFLESAISDSAMEQTPYNDGVNFEKYLSVLL